MQQEVKVVARTYEVAEGETPEKLNNDLTLLSGKAAGVCYMPDDYFEDGVQNEEKAMKRAKGNSESGHHSVYDHGHITFVIKTNKMMCMILNSLGVYATSEKSARYTKMKPETELELQMYEKWRNKIQTLILSKYPSTDDDILSKRLCKRMGIEESKAVINGSCSHIKEDEYLENELNELKKSETLPSYKLAQENARYMISVFTPTTIEYTTSFRQVFLITDYLADLVNNCGHAKDAFSKKLLNSVEELLIELRKAVGDIKLHDNKNQYIRFLEAQHVGEMNGTDFKLYDDLEERLRPKKEVVGDSYTLVYDGSLAMLAQAQRHRTLRYTMCLQEPGEFGFYVPEIVKDAGLLDEWLHDINSVSYCVPQGTVVRITEQGLFEDFAMKCKERLCGRAQLEVMKSTTDSVKLFIDNKENLSYSNQKLLNSMTLGDKPCARCMFDDFKCSEGCQWGVKEALTRLI
mgnify:CR=1 FL=1